MKKLIAVHPINEDLRFLRKLRRFLGKKYGERFVKAKLNNNIRSHEYCLQLLANCKDDELVCFFCHGREKSLLGCSYRAGYPEGTRGRFVYEESYGTFINPDNIHVIKNAKVFCLACNSNGIGEIAVEAGTKVFIGFSGINFDSREFITSNKPNKLVTRLVKQELRKAVTYSLAKSIDDGMQFQELATLLKLCLGKSKINLIHNHDRKSVKSQFYFRAAACLDEIASGIKVHGDGTIQV